MLKPQKQHAVTLLPTLTDDLCNDLVSLQMHLESIDTRIKQVAIEEKHIMILVVIICF